MKLKMTLLSDAIPGSGEGLAGLIDNDISYDKHGIPYIPSKRIKGILRESAKELKDANLLNMSLDEIFGKGGSEKGCDFKISNGYIQNYEVYRELLEYTSHPNSAPELNSIFNREQILEYFTYNRAQTAINGETGAAMENTLRTCRVMRKGLVFFFDVEFKPQHKEILAKIVKVTRSLGNSRTRGLGQIRMELISGGAVDEKEPQRTSPTEKEKFDSNDLCHIPVNITNLSQLLLSIEVGENQVSERYIPGSFLLGALAHYYISEKKIDPANDLDFRRLFVSGEVTYTNAYPAYKEKTFYPSPFSIVKEKDKEEYFDLAREKDREKVYTEFIQTKGGIGDFSDIDNGQVKVKPGSTQIEYHHRRHEDKSIGHAKKASENKINGDPGAFFQFEVLSPGQHFKSNIVGKYEDIKKLKECLKDEMILYMGKSKTAQYGKSLVKFGDIKKVCSDSSMWENNDTIVITLSSDMILINEHGFPQPDMEILKNEIAEVVGVDSSLIVIEGKFVKSKKIGGFLGVWNLPKIQAPAIAAGSTVILRNNSGTNISLNSLSGRAFGLRTEEGFGQIFINRHGSDEIKKEEFKEEVNLIVGNVKNITPFIEYILLNRLKQSLKKEALEKAEVTGVSISGSFINRMILFVKNFQSHGELQDILNNLKKQSKEQLRKFATHLYIENDLVTLKQNEFSSRMKELRDSSKSSSLRENILDLAGLSEDFYEGEIFTLYKTYALHYLNCLKYEKRRR